MLWTECYLNIQGYRSGRKTKHATCEWVALNSALDVLELSTESRLSYLQTEPFKAKKRIRHRE